MAGDERPILMVEQGGRGGVADYTSALVTALVEAGERVELVTASDYTVPVASGVRVHPLVHYLRPTSRLRRGLRDLRLGPVLNALFYVAAVPRIALRASRCRVVHLQGGYPPLTAVLALALRAVRAPVVHTPHNTFDRGRQFPRARALVERLVGRTVVHARADLPRLSARGAARAVVIPHGEYGALARAGGPADREAARAELGVDEALPVTLLFGQLRPDKGVRDLLEAARGVPDLRVVLAGEDLGALEEAADVLADGALADRLVVRSGFQPMEVAARLFAAADTVALPYQVASQSGVLLLAYGFARPVVVYPVGGLPEAVEDGETGWVCARADPAALAEALRAAADAGAAECLRRGAAGERLARERFGWPAIAQRTGELYRELAQDS